MSRLVIFTDLDGTLLNHDTYSFEEATPALSLLKEHEIPLVFTTSKTKAENEYYRDIIGINEPFVVENGNAVYIPNSYFAMDYEYVIEEEYDVIEQGVRYEILRDVLRQIVDQIGIELIGFGDMTAEELSADCGLTVPQARLAKMRGFTEPFRIVEDEELIEQCKELAAKHELQITKGGRYYHLQGQSSKGKAVQRLIDLYKKQYGEIDTIGLGDAQNDVEMFAEVGRAFLLPISSGYLDVDLPNLTRVEQPAPLGWNQTIINLLEEYGFEID